MTVTTGSPSDRLSPSESVVELVSMYAETDPLELPLLYDAVDPDALDALVEAMDDGTVEFRYAGYSVTVDSDGTVSIAEEPERGPERAEPAAEG